MKKLLLAAALCLVVSGCISASGRDTAAPLNTARAFVEAVKAGDTPAALECLVERSRGFARRYPAEVERFQRQFVDPYKGKYLGYELLISPGAHSGEMTVFVCWRTPGRGTPPKTEDAEDAGEDDGPEDTDYVDAEEPDYTEGPGDAGLQLLLERNGGRWGVKLELAEICLSQTRNTVLDFLLKVHIKATAYWSRRQVFPAKLKDISEKASGSPFGYYSYRYTRTHGGRGYNLRAEPTKESPVKIHYFISEEGVIRASEYSPAGPKSEPIE
jgi:hypothetical protein